MHKYFCHILGLKHVYPKIETKVCESWQNLWVHSMRGVWSLPKMPKNLTRIFHTLVTKGD